jgi:transposase InsO family protein
MRAEKVAKGAMEMPWRGKTVEENREEFVKRVMAQEKSKSALCLEYGISRPTGDKWIKRYKNSETMENQSKAPHKTPNKTPEAIEKEIVELRRKHPAIGAKKLKRILENKGKPAPAYSTINAILHRNRLITKEASEAASAYVRFEKEYPNEMWQGDFKGHFGMVDKNRCHPLTVIDDKSRYCLCIDAKKDEKYPGVQVSMIKLFEEYGLPDTFLCDNGNPWGTSQSIGYTNFEVWLMELGVLTKHGRIRHPQTQGKDERFNGSLKRELLKHKQIRDLSHAQAEFNEYRYFYNNERPHHALNLELPVRKYRKSERKYDPKIVEWEYSDGLMVRKVKNSGYLTFNGQGYFLSEAFGGKVVAVRESQAHKGIFRVLFRQFCIASVDANERVVISRNPFVVKAKT